MINALRITICGADETIVEAKLLASDGLQKDMEE